MPDINIKVQGYFVNYDQYNRAKLMFLDDYDDNDQVDKDAKKDAKKEASFAKKYMLLKMRKTQRSGGNSPVSDDGRYFLIKCPKGAAVQLDQVFDPNSSDSSKPKKKPISLVPIESLKQHKVECIVRVCHYNFTKNDEKISGWNLKLLKMSLLEM
jgi:hypothetical protein